MADAHDPRGPIAPSAAPTLQQDEDGGQQHLVIVSAKSGSVNSAAEGGDPYAHLGTLVCWRSASEPIDAADTLSNVASRRNGASPYLCGPGEGAPVGGMGQRSVGTHPSGAVVGMGEVAEAASPAAEPLPMLTGLNMVLTVACIWAILYFLISCLIPRNPPEVQSSIPGDLPVPHRRKCGLNAYFAVCSDATRCNCVRHNLPED